jgi:hypothetical protein
MGLLRNVEKWLVSEANLIFHVDASAMGNAKSHNASTCMIKNSRPIFDYAIDGTSGQILKNGKIVLDILNTQKITNSLYKIKLPIKLSCKKMIQLMFRGRCCHRGYK